MDQIALDTTFLIDLQNERRVRGRPVVLRRFYTTTRNVEHFRRVPGLVVMEYAA
jgi:hypothetical protein